MQLTADATAASGYANGEDASQEENMTETSTGLREGQQVPTFELPDEEGRPFNLPEQLQERSIVLVFYRGDW